MVSVGQFASKQDYTTRPKSTLMIDPNYPSNYSVVMNSLEQTDQDLQRLEKQLRQLLAQIQKLREENKSLHVRQDSLVTERASLVAKNDEARSRVEAMINRLKGLEQT
jgi:cell division protein ZapB